ncbi:unnamed protein product [Rhizophagus irregularis]|nr:unnamed protein product [Rhizophagus irregularis]
MDIDDIEKTQDRQDRIDITANHTVNEQAAGSTSSYKDNSNLQQESNLNSNDMDIDINKKRAAENQISRGNWRSDGKMKRNDGKRKEVMGDEKKRWETKKSDGRRRGVMVDEKERWEMKRSDGKMKRSKNLLKL